MIQYNSTPGDANLDDVLEQLKRDIFITMNCHAHATVQSFDPVTQTITATINYQKTIFISSSPGQLPVPTAVNYPVLVGCPVHFPQGGGISLTFPVATGDQCLIAFNDRDMDNYLAASVVTTNNTARAHSFSDGFAFVGFNPSRMALTNFNMTHGFLSKGSVGIGVDSKVLITNTYPTNTVTLNTLLQNLITQIENLTVAAAAITVTGVTAGGGVSGIPVNASTILALSTTISGIATQIGGLLE